MQYYNKKTGKRITSEQAYKMRDNEKIVIDETRDSEPNFSQSDEAFWKDIYKTIKNKLNI